ncbi:15-hydroxyprostaglandin dehydrogenase [NAD(+)]-like isoform X2 [Pieris brassicae]|uniref:15-hydroxyprostaglandin dehydrogenase [NAD(+)] n=1 Tax=Pieris brassicae TaxID=7116 RepID=A0A9P0WYW8_PIEBR|nr:15-hydroxyprostaglandin dehydrogenase [NAD(+)]-like isoform X2 [Pieris brassicae]CAH3893959.1 unnamed protein product [Pieris brassicae]
MVWSVDNKVVLVTGGAAGVGAGLVRELLARNAAHVAFLDVAVREGAALENELLNKFGALRAKFIKCDITKEGELSEAYKQVHDKYRRLDVVVNNAGIVGDNEMSREIIDVNFCGTVTSTLKALSIMRADVEGSGGAVINVSSSHAFKPSSLSVYNATKAAGDESGMKVRIITVCLGPTDTALLHKRNLNNFATDAHGLTSEPQRVESAVNGIIEVMQRADNGTTWMISNNDMARDVTRKVRENLKVLSEISEPL